MAEKSGDLMMKKLANMQKKKRKQKRPTLPTIIEEENTDMLLNRLISDKGRRQKTIILSTLSL